jgi:Rps23 Pro-64 3,4-dihydroxylase Tpa1-like proline 4-hydroxylase
VRRLFYTNYRSGISGLSNGIMSIEIGVVLASLTDRFLVLDGNASPPANIVSYEGRVSNARPSRVTDLVDLPVPWGEPDGTASGEASLELTSQSLWDVAFHHPRTLDVSSDDAQSFAHVRRHWVTLTEEHDRVPILRVSEDPVVPGTNRKRRNLSFYSYLFYLDADARRAAYRLLARMTAKEPFAALARRVAADLGTFNAVHVRRGDFKQTPGMTTLERSPREVIEALDHHFSRKDVLLIVTDERQDPFFREIEAAYPRHVFVDHHILDAYERDFRALPQTDSLALAYLSQLVAAESQDFVGSMRSTFTALIQRYRGNRGRHERFQFLWNEIPADGDPVVRGRQRINRRVALERGIMVEEHPGPYSWNRYSRRIMPGWMREWPESFLTPQVLATGILPALPPPTAAVDPAPRTGTTVSVRIQLAGGHAHTLTLPESAPALVELFTALAAPERSPGLIQVPLHDGATALSFRAAELVSVITSPPVVVEVAAATRPTAPPARPPRCVVLDDFLGPEEHREMLYYALACEDQFEPGTVATREPGYRRNAVILEFGGSEHAKLIENRLLLWFPLVMQALGEPVFSIGSVESQLTAGNDRDFFKMHNDSGEAGETRWRALSCIYFFHREPRGFAGGELRLFDVLDEGDRRRPAESFQVVEPISNRLVVFLSDHYHEVLPIRCPSREFADSRFSVTSWIRRGETPDPEKRFGWGHFRCGAVPP